MKVRDLHCLGWLAAASSLTALHTALPGSASASVELPPIVVIENEPTPRWILTSEGAWMRPLASAERARLDLQGEAWFVAGRALDPTASRQTLLVPGSNGLRPQTLELDRLATADPVQFTMVNVQAPRNPVVNEIHDLVAFSSRDQSSRLVLDLALDASGAPIIRGLAGGIQDGDQYFRVLGHEAHWDVDLPLGTDPGGLMLFAHQGQAKDKTKGPAGRQFSVALIGDLLFCEANRANWAARLHQMAAETRAAFNADGGTGADPALKLAVCHITGLPASSENRIDEATRCTLGGHLTEWIELQPDIEGNPFWGLNQADGLTGKSCMDGESNLYIFSSCAHGIYADQSDAPNAGLKIQAKCMFDKAWNALEYVKQSLDTPPIHLVQVLTEGEIPGNGGRIDGLACEAKVQGICFSGLGSWNDPTVEDLILEAGRSLSKDVHQSPGHEMGHNFQADHDQEPLDLEFGGCETVFSMMVKGASPCAARVFSLQSKTEMDICLQNDWCPRIGTR